jgi:dipeptidase D
VHTEIIARFRTLCDIPHCSFETASMQAYLENAAIQCGAQVWSDKAGNILARKGTPQLCLQSHYDMVCMGEAPNICVTEAAGYIQAENDASLGADNGIGVAIMLEMLSKHEHLECLFTNDEEVGLLGANALELTVASSYLLNLDSEEEGKVFVGCAGGVDIKAHMPLEMHPAPDEARFYEVSVEGLSGGHSGIQIHERIPHAIKVLAKALLAQDCTLVSIEGGERINAIPAQAHAIVATVKPLSFSDERVKCLEIKQRHRNVLAKSDTILKLIEAFAQGVRAWDVALEVPDQSINFSTLRQEGAHLHWEFFARAMSTEGLESLKRETQALLALGGATVEFSHQMSPWSPEVGLFARCVQTEASRVWQETSFAAIHAGLECGVLLNGQPNLKEVCSIGPEIIAPHTTKERCLVASIGRVAEIVESLAKKDYYGIG